MSEDLSVGDRLRWYALRVVELEGDPRLGLSREDLVDLLVLARDAGRFDPLVERVRAVVEALE